MQLRCCWRVAQGLSTQYLIRNILVMPVEDLESRGDHTPLPHVSAFDDDPLSLALVR